LTFGGKTLQDAHPLTTYGVTPGSTIFLLGRLRGGPLSHADFKWKLGHESTFSSPLREHHLKVIPGISSTTVASSIFSKLKDGTFSLKAWYDDLTLRVISNMKKKDCQIYWGVESVVAGVYSSEQYFQTEIMSENESFDSESAADTMQISQPSYHCSERDLRALEISGYEILHMDKVTSAKALKNIPLHSPWESHSKLWSKIQPGSDFALGDITSGYEPDKMNLFFERLAAKRLILRLGDTIMGHPEDVTVIYNVVRKRDRDVMEADVNESDDINKSSVTCDEFRRPIVKEWKSKDRSCHGCVTRLLRVASAGRKWYL